MDATALEETIRLHGLWIDGKTGGVRANLTYANLYRANLYRANLTNANLYRADLTNADLTGANLYRANLTDADLTDANLTDADLTDTNLYRADLYRANLTNANLTDANLTDAILTYAILTNANLTYANLTNANLTDANLTDANLTDANLTRATLPHFTICPEEGEFIAWKKLQNNVVAKLLIPAESKRTSSLIGRKCRAEFVKVISFVNSSESIGYAKHGSTPYIVGQTVKPDSYDDDIRVECTHGIHFFMTNREAENY